MRDLEKEIETGSRTAYCVALFATVAKVLYVALTLSCSCGEARSCDQ